MPGNKVLLDANAVLRYLIEDVAEQASIVEQAVIDNRAEVPIEVLAEVVYVLEGVYGLTRSRIRESLSYLLEDVSCRDEKVAIEAMSLFTGSRFDFVDCVLAAEHDVNGREVLTFDKKLLGLMKKLDTYR
ncbi:PIN domain-containing protein [Paratractidigestivibacter sp.]|uniref:PIN domain-containing protein n=1 Tax=Paratractidigestivibacter sp. TaxID=2847316 RepID=UPI002ABE26AA|nr:PIN domain-containing protein [Paratractidigestivibacter sp.]